MVQLKYGWIFSMFFGVFSFVSLVFPKQIGLLIVLLAVVTIIGLVKKKVELKINPISIVFILLYMTYIVGVFFSHDLSIGLKYAEYKLTFLVLPLLMSIRTNFEFTLRPAFIGLVSATIVLGISGFFNGYACYNNHSSNWLLYCFTSSLISPIHHPSYFSCFLLFALAGCWHGYFQKWKGFKMFPVIVYSIFALSMYFLCLSLAAFLFLGGVLIVLFIYLINRRFGKKTALTILAISLVLFPTILLNSPVIGNDFRVTTSSLNEYFHSPTAFLKSKTKIDPIPGNQKRLIMWTITTELIAENPLGVGTGNLDDFIQPRLEKYGFHSFVDEKLNPHNQFLQTTLEIGVFGGLELLLLFILIIYIAIVNRSYLLLLLGAGIAFNSLFESMFQRQSGIVFYTFWILLVLISLNHKKTITKDSLTSPDK